jgi:RHS repeat-associated protein
LKNNYLYQGGYSELDDDIGWNDFALRNYDAQIGRWVQQDPYQEFASPYVGMGDDPINLTDPSGGSILDGLSGVARVAVTTLGGAIIGTAVSLISGDDDFTGTLIGAGVGLGAGLGSLIKQITIGMGIATARIAVVTINNAANTVQVGRQARNSFDLLQMREKARVSTTVQSLESAIGIDDKTFSKLVSKGDGTYTVPSNPPKIVINKNNTITKAVQDYAHELSNASKFKVIVAKYKDAGNGTIKDRDTFADEMIKIESQAVINHIMAMLDLKMEKDISDSPEAIESVKNYRNKKIDRKTLDDEMFKQTKEKGVTDDIDPDTGKKMKAYKYYQQEFDKFKNK